MTAPRLSLIVPVYNVGPYLPRFLESVATLDATAIEVIFVDDGSTDDGPALLAEFLADRARANVSTLLRIRVHRQENRGLSGARNAGLDLARTPFVAFADPDDWFDAGYYERLLGLCEARELDMAVGNAMYHHEGRRPDAPIFDDEVPGTPMSGADFLRLRLTRKNLLHMVWMHVYRRSMLDAAGLRFIDRRIHEDVPWTTTALLAAQRLCYDPTPGYHYRIRIRRFSAEDQDRRLRLVIESSIENARALDVLVNGVGADAELQRLLRWQLVDGGLSIFHKLRRFESPAALRDCERLLVREEVHRLLWRNATEWRQRRRVARHRLRSWFGV